MGGAYIDISAVRRHGSVLDRIQNVSQRVYSPHQGNRRGIPARNEGGSCQAISWRSIAHTCNEQELSFFHESGITCLERSDFRSVRPVAPTDSRGIWW